jgi:hypothetical protein
VKYSIVNKGTGVVMLRIFIPESQTTDFLEFIHQQEKKENQTLSVKKFSHTYDENYFIELSQTAVALYGHCIKQEMSKTEAISETLKLLKGTNFYNISYDNLKITLSKAGCFRA